MTLTIKKLLRQIPTLKRIYRNSRKVLSLLTPKERKRGLLVLVLVTMMAVFEVAGVASVMPFLSVMGNPGLVETNDVLASLYSFFGFTSTRGFLIALGLGSFGLVVFSACFRIFAHYVMNRYIQMRRHSLSMRLLETYLRQPYTFFLNRNSGDMAKAILSEVDQLIGNVLMPGIQGVAYAVVAAAMIAFLVVVDPVLALAVVGVIGGLYAVIFGFLKGILYRLGRRRADANRERFTSASEALSGIMVSSTEN